MGTRNISITDQAYERLRSLKRPEESFTDVINRLTGRRSVLELVGVLSESQAKRLRAAVAETRGKTTLRAKRVVRQLANA